MTKRNRVTKISQAHHEIFCSQLVHQPFKRINKLLKRSFFFYCCLETNTLLLLNWVRAQLMKANSFMRFKSYNTNSFCCNVRKPQRITCDGTLNIWKSVHHQYTPHLLCTYSVLCYSYFWLLKVQLVQYNSWLLSLSRRLWNTDTLGWWSAWSYFLHLCACNMLTGCLYFYFLQHCVLRGTFNSLGTSKFRDWLFLYS